MRNKLCCSCCDIDETLLHEGLHASCYLTRSANRKPVNKCAEAGVAPWSSGPPSGAWDKMADRVKNCTMNGEQCEDAKRNLNDMYNH